MFIQWRDEYKVGISPMDSQHQQLIGMLNELYKVVSTNAPIEGLWPLLLGFNRYAESHFETEREIARHAGVPLQDWNAHDRLHDAYRDRVAHFMEQIKRNEKKLAVQMLAFMNNWWLRHILVEDLEFSRLVNSTKEGASRLTAGVAHAIRS
ncbi:Hypothetical protein HDN1F_19180 [gamma proteobacterium HdN1]|nr:Hypothetical protein HDN1F_19180 [gamma proteobacterium HdN1]